MVKSPDIGRRGISMVRSKDTKPEVVVRKMLHAQGYRYRLHRSDLPGSPDLVFPARKKIIFVNGCFWHGHSCKNGARMPKKNTEYWEPKIARNVERDSTNLRELTSLGWEVLTVWECELRKSPTDLREQMNHFLG